MNSIQMLQFQIWFSTTGEHAGQSNLIQLGFQGASRLVIILMFLKKGNKKIMHNFLLKKNKLKLR